MSEGEGRVALVTGGSRGIGRAIALRLASAGFSVGVTARTVEPGGGDLPGSLLETVAEIEAAGGRAVPIEADLADPHLDRGVVVERAAAALGGPVQVVVNNAAAARRFELGFERMTAAEFRRQVEVNVWAPWDLVLHSLDGMRSAGGGWVLNISSMGAAPKVGPPYTPVPEVGSQCLYGSTKAMLDRLSTGAAMELWPDGIAVNSLAPSGAVATENLLMVAPGQVARAEPLETMAEAALALCTGSPRELTGRVTTSLRLLVDLNRAVRTLDGKELLPGWQPHEIDRRRIPADYLHAFNHEEPR